MRTLLYWSDKLFAMLSELGSFLTTPVYIFGLSAGCVADVILTSTIFVALSWRLSKFFIGFIG